MNAKVGVGAVIAALFLAFGAFGLNVSETSAVPSPPLTVSPTGTVASGTALTVNAQFTNIDNSARVWYELSGGATATTLNLVSASEATSATPAVLDITAFAKDDCPLSACGPIVATATPAGFTDLTATTQGAQMYEQLDCLNCTLDQYPVQAPQFVSVNYVLTTTVSCTTDGAIVFYSNQTGGPGAVTVNSVTVNCQAQASGILSIKKVDQNGGLRGATFAVQQEVPTGSGSWITIATMVTSGTNAATNPCLSSNAACTLNPSVNNPGTFAPTITTTPPAIPSGVPVRIIEVAQPANCTLVEIRDGANVLKVQPVTFANITAATSTERQLTWVNSCAIAGAPSAAGSSIAVVVGGGTFGLSNTTHVEIIPAPGSDDDARLDVRARDANNVPLVGAHVTVMIDKGAIAMRTDTSGTSPSGYEVIEPSPAGPGFGSNAYGDTCDQTIFQAFATPYTANNTNPFINTSRTIQDSFTNNDGIVSACVYVNPDMAPGITPGKITVTAIIEMPGTGLYNPYSPQNLVLTASITVVGPPASIRVAASPTSVQCGEKSTITATVTDSVGQNVSDHTRIELISNFGATIGGTGSTLGFPGQGLVNPLSSSAAETFSGIATAFLLTSTEHVGPYEVVVATGGSVGGVVTTAQPGVTYTTGNFSTAPVSAQVTVTCALPVVAVPAAPVVAAPIAAPRTGEGIRPPNTGDAGLAADNGSWAFVLAGALAFALAGVASVKFARR